MLDRPASAMSTGGTAVSGRVDSNEGFVMSKFSRLIAKASEALDKKSAGNAGHGSSDWQGMVRRATDALGGDQRPDPNTNTHSRSARSAASPATVADRQAIAHYDYLMRTADPESVEQIHREAFERLTPAQRAQLKARMTTELKARERPRSSSPADLARAAGRSEAARPGRMRVLLAGAGGAAGVGLLGAVAGGAVLSAVAMPMLAEAAQLGVDFDSLAEGIDLGGLTEGAGELVAGAGEQVSGITDSVGSLGDQMGGFELPNLRDIFGG